MVPLRYNVRSLIVRKTTTIAAAAGVALVVAVLSGALMLYSGIRATTGRSGHVGNAIVLRKGSDAEMSSVVENRLIGVILAAPGVKKNVQGQPLGVGEVVIAITLARVDDPSKIGTVQVRGVPDNALAFRPEVRLVQGRPAAPGTDEAIVGREIVDRYLGARLGGTIELKKNRPLTVVGIFEANRSSFESEIWADIDTVRASFGREGIVSSVTVELESPVKFDAFAAAVQQDKQLQLKVQRESEFYESLAEDTSTFLLAMGMIFVFFFSLGAMIGAAITMYGAVAQRKREVGTLRALGFSRRAILLSFLVESVLLTWAGALVGALGSMALGFVKFSLVNFATFTEMVFSFDPTVSTLVWSIVVGVVMGVIGGFLPAWSAARVSPVQAMRD